MYRNADEDEAQYNMFALWEEVIWHKPNKMELIPKKDLTK